MRPDCFGLPRPGLLQETEEDDGVIGEILPHAGKLGAYVDAEFAQFRRRTEPGPNQKWGRMNAAERDDNVAAKKSLVHPADGDRNSGGAAALEQQVGDQSIGEN